MILWVFIEFFGAKIVITDIYRYFIDILPIFTDILPIFYRYFFKNQYFPIFRRKIGYFIDFSPIFPLIDFSSTFSSWCLSKTDFSAIYRSKKPIFLSLDVTTQPTHLVKKYRFQQGYGHLPPQVHGWNLDSMGFP